MFTNGIRSSEIQIADNVCVVGYGYMGLLMIQAMPKKIIDNLIALDIRSERLKLVKDFGADFTLNPRELKLLKKLVIWNKALRKGLEKPYSQ